MYHFSKYGRTYKDFETQKWVSYKPKKFFVGYDKYCFEIYTGDIIRFYDRISKQYSTLTVEDCPTHSGRISNYYISFSSKDITLIRH